MLRLAKDDLELLLAPEIGGSIAALRWRGFDLLRSGDPAGGPLAMASFPLVPFSNRIAGGRFVAGDRRVQLASNFSHLGTPQTIHGFGWQSGWDISEKAPAEALLTHHYLGGDWPWPYVATQRFAMTGDALMLTMTLRNDGDSAMPAGLGLHPYFPREQARLTLNVSGRWQGDGQALPTTHEHLAQAPDWFSGEPIDHCFTGRAGPIHIGWPGRSLTIIPDAALAHTIIYVPPGADYFCVEPVSHMTNALNRSEPAAATGLHWLAPGESWAVSIQFAPGAG